LHGDQVQGSTLDGTVAIVTGGGRGIGRGVSLHLAGLGAQVVVATRTLESGNAVAKAIRGSGGTAIAIQCDVGDAQQVEMMVARTLEAFGTVHTLVNNAQAWSGGGLSNVRTPIEEVPEEWWDEGLRSGLYGTWYCSKAVLPAMKAQGYGKIVNLASHAGIAGNAGTVTYNCVKEAIRAFTKTAAREWGRYGVRVNVICPAVITDAVIDSRAQTPDAPPPPPPPVGYWGEPERDVGSLVAFLAGHGSDYITGNTLFPAGGLYFV
jgi:2-hydroxycyclohexanecarboxyl-CoA dehydrogenase